MATQTLKVAVDWDNDAAYTGTGEDITSRVLDIAFFRGRDRASQLTGRSISGTLKATVNNESGDYSSFKGGSPIAGDILPGRRVQVQTDDGFPYTFPILFAGSPLWTGRLMRLTPSPMAGGVRTVELIATGPLGYLNQRDISLAMATSKGTGAAIGDVLDEANWPAGDRALDTGQTTMTRWWVDNLRTIDALRKPEETEGGFIYEAKDGKIVFEDRHHRLASPHTVSQATYSDAPGAALAYTRIEQDDPLPNVFNIMDTAVTLYSVAGVAVVWTHPETGSSSPVVERNGGTRVFWAVFPNPDSATDAVGIDAWTTLAATTDYVANSEAGGGGDNLTASIAVAVVATGNRLKITLTNNHAMQDAYMTKLQARGTIVTSDDPVRVTAEDTTSQSVFGERNYPNPAEYIPDTQEALDWGRYNLAAYKDIVPFLAVTLSGNRDDTHMFEAMVRDISDRVTLVGTARAGLGINEDFFVEAISTHIQPGGRLDVTWLLSPSLPVSDYWILGTSALDTQTRLVY